MVLVPDADSAALELSIAENLAFNAGGLCSLPAEETGLLDAEWETRAESDLELRAIRDGFRFYTQNRGALFLGTHFPTHPGGRIRVVGDCWRFEPQR